jgi:hypothetical protein
MIFENTNGLNKLSIRLIEIGSYFYYTKPLATVWYDCTGSLGKYLCSLPCDQEMRNEIRKTILDSVDYDYTNKLEDLKETLNPLFNLFPNGQFSLDYYHSIGSKFFDCTSSRDNYSEIQQHKWHLLFSEPINIKDAQQKLLEYEQWKNNQIAQGKYVLDLVDFSTQGFYSRISSPFIATQPKSEVNDERVLFYEDKIKSGERPYAIIFGCQLKKVPTDSDANQIVRSFDSENYVLDGHHKLLAYYNLRITPSIVKIKHLATDKREVNFDISDLQNVLYPWQLEHLAANWAAL